MSSTVQTTKQNLEQAVPTVARRVAAQVQSTRQLVPDALADVSLVDAKQIAAAACISLTTWYELVQNGKAPQPVIRAHRHTRWRLTDVRAWLLKYANRADELEGDPSEHPVVQRARNASRAAGLAKSARAGA